MTTLRTLALAGLAALILPLAAAAGSLEVTNSYGGTLNEAWTCTSVDGIWTCDNQTLITNAEGQTANHTRTTTFGGGQGTTTVSGTRLNGGTFSRTVHWSR